MGLNQAPHPDNWVSLFDLAAYVRDYPLPVEEVEKPRMKNLKPSQLPEGTVIDDDRHGEYIKRADGLWEETSCDYMGDRERVVDISFKDSGMTHKEWYTRYPTSGRSPSDEHFKSFKIIAVPPGFVLSDEMLHGPWDVDQQIYADNHVAHYCKGYNCDYEY
jgi:hypothetical protein